MADPESDGRDVYEAQKARGRLVVAGGNTGGIFEFVEAPLDQVAQGKDVKASNSAGMRAPAVCAPDIKPLRKKIGWRRWVYHNGFYFHNGRDIPSIITPIYQFVDPQAPFRVPLCILCPDDLYCA